MTFIMGDCARPACHRQARIYHAPSGHDRGLASAAVILAQILAELDERAVTGRGKGQNQAHREVEVGVPRTVLPDQRKRPGLTGAWVL